MYILPEEAKQSEGVRVVESVKAERLRESGVVELIKMWVSNRVVCVC